MCQHHLCNSDSASPAYVVGNSDLKLALISLRYCGQKDLHLLDVILQKRLEVTSVAEPEESPELLLELVLDYGNLLFNTFLTIFVNGKRVIHKINGQMVWSFNFNFISADQLEELREKTRLCTLLRC